MNVDQLSQITALTGGNYGADAELARLRERRGELMQKLQDTVSPDETEAKAVEPLETPAVQVTIKDIAKELKEVDRRSLQTQFEEQTRQIEAEGRKNLEEIARKQRQRDEAQKKAGDRAGVLLSGSLTHLLAADNRAGTMSAMKEPATSRALGKEDKAASLPSSSGAAAVYDSGAAYEGRRYMRWMEHETRMVAQDVKSSAELGAEAAKAFRQARREKMQEEEKERLGLVPRKKNGTDILA